MRHFRINHSLLLASFLCIASTTAKSQNTDSLIKYVQETFPDEKALVTDIETTLSFQRSSSTGVVAATETGTATLQSLARDVKVIRTVFYDQYSEIIGHKLRNNLESKVKYDYMRCGDFEIDGLFYHDAKVCRFLMFFEESGEHNTLSYDKRYTDLRYLSHIPLSDDYRIARMKVTIRVPDYLGLKLTELNFEGFDITKTVSYDSKEKLKVYEYTAHNIPPMEEVENLPGYSCSFPQILVVPEYYVSAGADTTNIFRSPDDLYNWYVTLIKKKDITPELASFTDELVKKAGTDDERIAAVLQWIGERIRYIAFENGTAAFVPEDAASVFEKRYGDCKGMSNLAATMLRHLGFDARLGWIYSGRTCIPDSVVTLAESNHMICVVMRNTGPLFLDATLKYGVINEIQENIQGKRCVIENDGKYEILRVPGTLPLSNLTTVNDTVLINGNRLQLSGNMSLKGAQRLTLQYWLDQVESEEKENMLKSLISVGGKSVKVNSLLTSSQDTLSDTFRVNYNLEVPNALVQTGTDILLSLDFRNEFKSQKIEKQRRVNYELEGRLLNEQMVVLKIPGHLKVRKLPDPIQIARPGYVFSGSYEAGDGVVRYHKRIEITDEIVRPDEFGTWNDFISKINRFYKDMIVLTVK
ncbi:MAG: transglutaminase domain-containing protein [Bacteroidales bacterium]|nr:transglutaminase domain-containing protein [Bacteroidales bacterium]